MGATNWNQRFFLLAKHVSEWSRDPSTRVGCVIVGTSNEIRAIGYNGLPRSIEDSPSRLERPQKYAWVEHAERNAIYAAARAGVPLEGCRMYVSWFPCIDCARAIVQVGITHIFGIEPDWVSEPWGPQFRTSKTLLEEAGVAVSFINDVGIAASQRQSSEIL
jgi:dCMP deaminase